MICVRTRVDIHLLQQYTWVMWTSNAKTNKNTNQTEAMPMVMSAVTQRDVIPYPLVNVYITENHHL